MKESDNPKRSGARAAATGWDPIGGAETLLRSEIAFWREMIAACESGHPAASLERMRNALAFAEYRLLHLYGEGRTSGCPQGTSARDPASLN